MTAIPKKDTPANTNTTDKGYVTLIDHQTGRQFDFPILKGTQGPDVIDVRKLYGDTG